VENTYNFDSILLDEIGNSVMTIKKNSYLFVWFITVFVADF